jgi:L,D-transpeptidase ErfK/SrfK
MNLALATRLTAAASIALSVTGCQLLQRQHEAPPPPAPVAPTIHEPVATHLFQVNGDDQVVGELQVTKVMGEDTLPDIARRFNLGYEEIARANPGVDPWVPGEGREIVLPTQFVLPAAPHEGLVINLAQLRVFYFPKVKEGEPQTVITHPIGIGKVGWQTPEGTTKVTGKRTNPTWFPPSSVRKEHREAGDPLPSKVPPGPDNPLGAYMMTLGWPSYLIHGTNKPYGVGLRSSHGCMRFYPEDIAELYGKIPVGTKVTVVNQPFVFGWHDGALYVQAFPVMEDDQREHPKAADKLLNAAITDDMWKNVKEHGAAIDLEVVNGLMAQPRGIALPVSKPKMTVDTYVAAARHVENRVPSGANWNGSEEMYYTAEEFEAARDGVTLPKKPAPKATKKTATKPAATATTATPAPRQTAL